MHTYHYFIKRHNIFILFFVIVIFFKIIYKIFIFVNIMNKIVLLIFETLIHNAISHINEFNSHLLILHTMYYHIHDYNSIGPKKCPK